MLVIRRGWLLSTVRLLLVLYYLYHSSTSRGELELSSPQGSYRADNQNVVQVVVLPEKFPIRDFARLPTSPAKQLPRVQYDFPAETTEQKKERLERLNIIKEAFAHTWNGYKKFAWRQDEVSPLSGYYRNPFGGWGATLADSLGTLWIMGMRDDFEMAVRAVDEIDFSTSGEEMINVFETTIRYLGGLLSAYDLSDHKYPALLAKSIELANILYITFDTENRLPCLRWNRKESAQGLAVKTSRATLLAEIGSLNVEFTRLAQLTGDNKWFDAVDRITDLLHKTQDTTKIPGLWPTIVDAVNGDLSTYKSFTFGGMADSTYEYLPKQYILLGGLQDRYRDMYDKVIQAAKDYLFFRPLVPGNPEILISGSAITDGDVIHTDPQGQHLTCFTGGMVALAAKIFDRPEEITIAKQLVDGCVWAYNSTPSGLMPETFRITPCYARVSSSDFSACEWSEEKWYEAVNREHGGLTRKGESVIEAGKRIAEVEDLLPAYSKWGDSRYILRPEAIESVFYLYRITGDRTYLDHAWRMWSQIDSACRTPIAFAAVADIRSKTPAQVDRMESFWLAETLKYFFLMYSDPNDWSLDEWVLNTEAHLIRRPRAGETLIKG